jgi:hypothetical protein
MRDASVYRLPTLASCAFVLLLLSLLSGCGFQEPREPASTATEGHVYTTAISKPGASSSKAHATSTPTRVDPHEPAAERGGTVPASSKRAEDEVLAGAASPTPQSALRRYTDLYMNWTAGDLRKHQLELAEISVGAARLLAQESAARVQGATPIGQDSVSNSGEVVSIAQGSGSASGYWVIVTDERTHGSGEYRDLPAQVHVTYASVKHVEGGWVISAWEPQD